MEIRYSSNTPFFEHHDGGVYLNSVQCETEAYFARVKKAGTSSIFFIRRGL
jgi:hypothetical protein